MPVVTRSERIGTHDYVVTQFGGKQGGRVLTSLLAIVGPVMKGLASAQASWTKQQIGAQVIGILSAELDPLKLEALETEFAGHTKIRRMAEINGETKEIDVSLAPLFDSHFAGDMLTEKFEWLLFAIEVNYARFFPVANLRSILKEAAKNAMSSPPRSTGESGESLPQG